MDVSMHTSTYVYGHADMYAYHAYTHAYTRVYIRADAHVYARVYTHAHAHVYGIREYARPVRPRTLSHNFGGHNYVGHL